MECRAHGLVGQTHSGWYNLHDSSSHGTVGVNWGIATTIYIIYIYIYIYMVVSYKMGGTRVKIIPFLDGDFQL